MADTQASARHDASPPDGRAAAFVAARRTGSSLAAYPGPLPASLAEAYAIQAEAILLWPDALAGWKVGRINPPWDQPYGSDRLAGPIFAGAVQMASANPAPAYIFARGFGAIEGEILIQIAADAPPEKRDWSPEEAKEIAGRAFFGAEIAASPFAEINDHGPLVTISDFGNNNGMVCGAEIPDWKAAAPADWQLRTLIDGVEIGIGNATSIPGGPLESFRALLEISARRGLPLRAGMYASTGAVTGVHAIRIGQRAELQMVGLPSIHVIAAAVPQTA